MEFLGVPLTLDSLNILWQIIFIDIVLAGDNAIIVGMVASRVDPELRQKVILFGVGAAVVMRIAFSLVAVQLLAIPGLTFVGGLLLLWVSWRLGKELWTAYREEREESTEMANEAADAKKLTALRPAIIQIVIADLSMSIDNVLAIAGIARDHKTLLIFGLALSVAFMIFAATFIANLLKRYPWVAWLGVALIVWVGFRMIFEGGHDLYKLLT